MTITSFGWLGGCVLGFSDRKVYFVIASLETVLWLASLPLVYEISYFSYCGPHCSGFVFFYVWCVISSLCFIVIN